MARWLKALAAVLLLAAAATARKSPAPNKHEPQIEEVTAKQLERTLEDKDFVAVYWCKWPLARCLPTGARLRLILRAFESWPPARAGALVAVSKRLRRRPSKWVIVELMIFGRAERKTASADSSFRLCAWYFRSERLGSRFASYATEPRRQ